MIPANHVPYSYHFRFEMVRDKLYSPLEIEVMKIFNLDELPSYFDFYKPSYEHFLSYIRAKGPYQPNPSFLQTILQMIHKSEYPYCSSEIQTIETKFFIQTGGFSKFITKIGSAVKKSVSLQNQSQKIGFSIEMQLKPHSVGEVPKLVEMCYKVLLENGYPQAFLNKI